MQRHPQGFEPRGCVDFNFNGIYDQLVIAPNPIRGSFTISFWIKTKQFGTGRNLWWEGKGLIDGDFPTRRGFGVSLMEGGLIGFGFGTKNGDITLKSQRRVDDDEWRHVVVTRELFGGNKLAIYIDGALDA